MVVHIIPTSLKNTFTEHSNKLSPKVKVANKRTHGMISNNLKEYTMPNQCMIIRKTNMVMNRLNSSLSISERGKNKEGIFIDLRSPAEPTIFPTDCPVTFEKKNQSTRPEVV